MAHYRYLIIGGGMTGDAAVRGMRNVDADGSIGIISAEPDPPYKRPPLSKALWKGNTLDSIWSKTEALGADLHLGCTVQAIEPANKHVVDDRGAEYTYDKLLLAIANPALGKRLRVEHEDNANTMGRTAGQNMAGELTPYHHLLFRSL